METVEADATVVTTVRLSSELRDQIARAASANQRSLSAEIVKRLIDSLSPTQATSKVTAVRNSLAHGVDDNRSSYNRALSPHEQSLLVLFGNLPPERQLALLTLLNA